MTSLFSDCDILWALPNKKINKTQGRKSNPRRTREREVGRGNTGQLGVMAGPGLGEVAESSYVLLQAVFVDEWLTGETPDQ